MRSRPSPWRWLAVFPPAAGMVISAILLAWPAAAIAAPVAVAAESATAVQFDVAQVHETVTGTLAATTAHQDAVIWRAYARREAARDVRQEIVLDAAQEASMDAAQAAKRAHAPRPATQPAVAAPAPAAGIYSYGQLEALWVSAGGPASVEAAAATIAECESGGNPNAYNPSGASGLFQILGQVVSGNIFNPMVNALNAVAKYKAAGDSFSPWVCAA